MVLGTARHGEEEWGRGEGRSRVPPQGNGICERPGPVDANERTKDVLRVGAELGEEMLARVEDAVDTRDIVQRALEAHLAPEVVGHDVEATLSEAEKLRGGLDRTDQGASTRPDRSEVLRMQDVRHSVTLRWFRTWASRADASCWPRGRSRWNALVCSGMACARLRDGARLLSRRSARGSSECRRCSARPRQSPGEKTRED